MSSAAINSLTANFLRVTAGRSIVSSDGDGRLVAHVNSRQTVAIRSWPGAVKRNKSRQPLGEVFTPEIDLNIISQGQSDRAARRHH